jgi:hypothetical protein
VRRRRRRRGATGCLNINVFGHTLCHKRTPSRVALATFATWPRIAPRGEGDVVGGKRMVDVHDLYELIAFSKSPCPTIFTSVNTKTMECSH